MINMKKIVVYAFITTIIILCSVSVVAKKETAPGQIKVKNEDAPGQWKKINEYATQREYVQSIHWRNWLRISARGGSPPGLMKLVIDLLDLILSPDMLEESEGEEHPEDDDIEDEDEEIDNETENEEPDENTGEEELNDEEESEDHKESEEIIEE
jgi:hypothetical protein